MTTAEAIARTNEFLADTDYANYFSPKQPAAFVEAVRSVNLDWRPPFTDEQCQAIADSVVANMQGLENEAAADYEMTAKTPKDQRAYVDDLIAQANDAVGVRVVKRPTAWAICFDLHVTIYKERWHGRRDGDNFVLPTDRQKVADAFLAWAREYKDA